MSQFQEKVFAACAKKEALFDESLGRYALRSMLAGAYLTMSTAVGIIGADVIATGIPALSRFVFAFIFAIGLVLINSVGVIDGDYYGNPGNEGHIFAQMKNITDQPVTLEVGERIVQGVFMPFLIVDGDEADGVRTGGFGSTGK